MGAGRALKRLACLMNETMGKQGSMLPLPAPSAPYGWHSGYGMATTPTRSGAAALMGVTIAGMHYTGTAAKRLTP